MDGNTNKYKYNENIESKTNCSTDRPCVFWTDIETKNKYPEIRANRRNLPFNKINIYDEPPSNLLLNRDECEIASQNDPNGVWGVETNLNDRPKGCYIVGKQGTGNSNNNYSVYGNVLY